MTGRVLTQLTIAFILGVIGFEAQGMVRFWLWCGFGVWMAVMLYRRSSRERQDDVFAHRQKQKPEQTGATAGQQRRRPERVGVSAGQQDQRPERAGVTAGQQRRRAWRYISVLLRLGVVFLFLLLGWRQSGQQQALRLQVGQHLTEDALLRVSGTIYHKEEREEEVLYYLKNSYLNQMGRVSCGRILVYHQADVYSIGDTIEVTGTGSEFRSARNEGNFDEKSYYFGKGILFRLRAQTIVRTKRARFAWRETLYRLKKNMVQVYVRHLPKEEAGVLSMMTLGEKGLLDPEIKKLYQQAGISHVLAISGLHISLLGMGMYRFLRRREISYRKSCCMAGAAVLCFGQLSGMELSARRAVLMFLVLLVGQAFGMAYDSVTALSLAALIQLWEYPQSLKQASFLFSYGAVLAVVVAARIWKDFCRSSLPEKRRGKGKEGAGKKALSLFSEALVMSSLIQLVTLPLTVYFYYECSVYAVLANGLLLPLMGLLLLFGLLGGAVGLFCAPLSALLLQPAHWLLDWNAFVCGKLQRLPGAVWITGRPQPVWMVGYYLVLALSLCVMYGLIKMEERRRRAWQRGQRASEQVRRERSPKESGKKRAPCVLAARTAFVCGAPMVVLLLLLLHAGARGRTEICFLDVGQGDGILIQTEEAAFFVDGGSSDQRHVGEYQILSFLKSRGIGRISGWFVSHADGDHISGLKEVWESGYRIEHLFLAKGMVKDDAWEELCTLAWQYGTKLGTLQPGDVLRSGSLELICLAPWEQQSDRNEGSLVLLAKLWEAEAQGAKEGKKASEAPREADGCLRILLAGDIGERTERLLLERYPRLAADLYKASHHGSNGSSSEALLERLKPALTVISCGANNRYGHPGKEATARIKHCGSRMLTTMDGGQITVKWHRGRIAVGCYCQF